jgi:predicted RNA-binding Zn ribbon-like protein
MAEHVFDISGGELCLDFANTVDKRAGGQPDDHLQSYGDLLSWGRQTGELDGAQAGRLERAARRSPGSAARVLRRAVVLREALYRIFRAVAVGGPVAAPDLAILNAEASRAAARRVLVPKGKEYVWIWREDAGLERILWPVARSAAELLASPRLGSVRLCAADPCEWLFLDTSKNRSRRWCNMRVCGNREKARRHYQRTRHEASGTV